LQEVCVKLLLSVYLNHTTWPGEVRGNWVNAFPHVDWGWGC